MALDQVTKLASTTDPRVTIIGAGPTGLFTAYELSRFARNVKVTIVDAGPDLKGRKKSLPNSSLRCPTPSEGYGGAGVFSDKLYFDAAGGWLEEVGPELEPQVYTSLVSEVYEKFVGLIRWQAGSSRRIDLGIPGLQFKPYPNLVPATLDEYLTLIKKIITSIEKAGVSVLFSRRASQIIRSSGPMHKFRVELEGDDPIDSDAVLIATGRASSTWFQRQAGGLGVELVASPTILGIRIETLTQRVQPLSDLALDPKLKSKDGATKIHCYCKGGTVISVKSDGMILVDGTQMQSPTKNTSFNVLTRLDGLGKTTAEGRAIATEIVQRGKGRPIVQRMDDFRKGIPSTARSIASGGVVPTLSKARPGDLTEVLPEEVTERLFSLVEVLSGVAPKLREGDNLVYGPVFEWFHPTVKMNDSWDTSVEGLFVAGDAAGHSQGVVMACASGIRIAFRIKAFLDREADANGAHTNISESVISPKNSGPPQDMVA